MLDIDFYHPLPSLRAKNTEIRASLHDPPVRESRLSYNLLKETLLQIIERKQYLHKSQDYCVKMKHSNSIRIMFNKNKVIHIMKYLTLNRYQLEKTSGGNISSLHQLKFGTSNPCIVKSDYSINLPNKFVVWRIILLQSPKQVCGLEDYFTNYFASGTKKRGIQHTSKQ
ncbi:hypothetical protein V6Z11_A09G037800 [Gossypium hirsutum]